MSIANIATMTVLAPLIARLAVGAALVVAGILILVLGRRRWKADQ